MLILMLPHGMNKKLSLWRNLDGLCSSLFVLQPWRYVSQFLLVK